jgi:hypothetical protein
MPQFVDAYVLGFPRPGIAEIGCGLVIIATFALILNRERRLDPFLVSGAWMITSALGYAERQHAYFAPLLGTIFVAGAFVLFRRGFKVASIVSFLTLATVTGAGTMFIDGIPHAIRNREQEIARTFAEVDGALFVRADLPDLAQFGALVSSHLHPNETFYTFTNLATLHFLFQRPIPIRELEVPMIESRETQQAVIARLRADRRVALVVEHYPYWSDTLDGIPNEQRAPLIASWIAIEFPERIEQNGIVVRVRSKTRTLK